MKGKTQYLFYLLTIAIVVAVLFVAKTYYAALALILSMLLICHREIWSLIRYQKLPPVDERIKENAGKSLRNSFIFFVFTMILTIVVYVSSSPMMIRPTLEVYLAILLTCVGVVYALSYFYYDKIEFKLSDGRQKLLRNCAIIEIVSFFVLFINAFFANAIYPVVETWLMFHQIMLIGSAITLAVSMIISLVVFIATLFNRPHYTAGD